MRISPKQSLKPTTARDIPPEVRSGLIYLPGNSKRWRAACSLRAGASFAWQLPTVVMERLNDDSAKTEQIDSDHQKDCEKLEDKNGPEVILSRLIFTNETKRHCDERSDAWQRSYDYGEYPKPDGDGIPFTGHLTIKSRRPRRARRSNTPGRGSASTNRGSSFQDSLGRTDAISGAWACESNAVPPPAASGSLSSCCT